MEESGFVSEEARKRFGRDVGLASVVAMLLTLMLPMVVMALMAPWMLMPEIVFHLPDLEAGAWWRGRLYYPVHSGARERLVSLGSEGGEPRVEVAEDGPSHLLAGADTLWAFSGSRLGRLEDGEIRWLTPQGQEPKASSPFLVEEAPALLVETPQGVRLRRWQDGLWRDHEIPAIPRRAERFHVGCTSAVWQDGRIVLVLHHDDGYWLEVGEGATWRPLPQKGTLLVWEGAPALVSARDDELVIRTLAGSGWDERLRVPFPETRRGVEAWAAGPRSLVLARPTSMTGVFLQRLEDGRLGEPVRSKGTDPFGDLFAAAMAANFVTFLVPVGLALFASTRMGRDRVCAVTVEGRQVAYASLTRRAVARIVDVAILTTPWVPAYALLLQGMETMPDFSGMWKGVVAALLALGWGLAMFLVFCWLEGTSGSTPGKRLAGIRVVGTDLQPCGFGRALLRNLLRMVDGMWCYMPGIVLVAFGKQWQRVGDMVGRTLVVRR